MLTSFLKIKKHFITFGLLAVISTGFISPSKLPDPSYKLLSGNNYVRSKNYYLITLFAELPEVKSLIDNDPVLGRMARVKLDSLEGSLKNCRKDGRCFVNSMKFSGEEITTAGKRIGELYQAGNPLDKLVRQHLIPSGMYILFDSLPPKEMLVKAWEQDANGINFAIGVYAGGEKPNYPNIDSISFEIRDKRDSNLLVSNYVSFLYNATSLVYTQYKKTASFYAPSLVFALQFLEMNEREQAADYEPIDKGENKSACEKVKKTNWSGSPYSLILIPGAGPDKPLVALSAESMLRCKLAAIQYEKGIAPFIVTSGGKVHPYKTKFCEAIEMKRYLIAKLNIPESAIIVDPHARHTTTNMRNTARLMYRYGFPFNKPAITCTTRGQSFMIETTLPARCMRELGAIPYRSGIRLSETELEFFPLMNALHINPTEPMDP